MIQVFKPWIDDREIAPSQKERQKMPKWTEKIEILDPDQFNSFIEIGQVRVSRKVRFMSWLSRKTSNFCHRPWWFFKEKENKS